MKNIISQTLEETGEILKDASKATVREVKDMGKIAKAQITGQDSSSKVVEEHGGKQAKTNDDKKDPVIGKKPPTKQQLSDLKNQTAQLQMAKLKKVREELEKQRLKVSQENQIPSHPQVGPEIKVEDMKPKDDAVKNTLKGSKSTGEFKGLVGG